MRWSDVVSLLGLVLCFRVFTRLVLELLFMLGLLDRVERVFVRK